MRSYRKWFCALGLAILAVPHLSGAVARAQDQERGDIKELRNLVQQGRNFQFNLQDSPHSNMVFWELAGGMGLALEKADDVLLAQLGLPAGEGLVVRKVHENSPASRAGIKSLDLLKSIEGKPLKNVEEAVKLIEESKEPVTVDLIRQGKPMQVKVTPDKKSDTNTLFAANQALGIQSDYWVGVEVSPVDDTLRSHLGIPAGQGLVATSVHQGSAAERAGLKANDILLSFGGKPLENSAALVREIQSSGGKRATIELIRAGKRLTSDITPDKREQAQPLIHNVKPDAAEDLVFRLVRPGWVKESEGALKSPDGATLAGRLAGGKDSPKPEKQLDQVLQELKALHKAIDDLQKAVKKD
ncbi:MAG TPA: PDZ domain-containing protein [Isosphaeraceae bacterium]|nr:PDZ domain-containing protein [Isosphaeraceae bacterium]